MGQSNRRLTDVVEGGRSYGGIGLLNIAATPISGSNSYVICGIKFTVNDKHRSMLSVISVYLYTLSGSGCRLL